jgi:hypothetical protein
LVPESPTRLAALGALSRGAQGCPGKSKGDSFERLPPNFAAKSPLPGLGPGIHVLSSRNFRNEDVVGRDKPGHGDAL